jgi:hypothetical protein
LKSRHEYLSADRNNSSSSVGIVHNSMPLNLDNVYEEKKDTGLTIKEQLHAAGIVESDLVYTDA